LRFGAAAVFALVVFVAAAGFFSFVAFFLAAPVDEAVAVVLRDAPCFDALAIRATPAGVPMGSRDGR